MTTLDQTLNLGATPSQEPHVLIVDDEEAILRALQRELRGQGFRITAFSDPFTALDAIQHQAFSLIISDNRMPGMTGIELFEQVKKIAPDTVRIILTGHTDMESAIKAINKGEIHRFIMKPWDKEQLLNHITEGLEINRLRHISKLLTYHLEEKNAVLTHANAELRNLVVRDRMTGLFHHAEFHHDMEHQIKLFKRQQQPFCLVLGDIDNFKRVNDTWGHPAGDAVIKAVAQLFQTTLRDEVDSAYRYGGEEFALILRNTPEQGTHTVLTRLMAKIRDLRIQASEAELSVTMSFGAAQFRPGWNKEDFISNVDSALYEAKRSGKNRFLIIPTTALSVKAHPEA